MQALIAGTERVAQGDLAARCEVSSRNEMGQLAAAFNRMTHQLGVAEAENDEWSRTLEKRVVEETEQRSRAQQQVLHMEKMASLGTLAATVAHELNN
ncbi:MAG TPA: two-component sensor histidine kinase, partial [Acidobacteria bacterium]|nr:two-component sensor histidine kinase [Acidobacteriota bacterium]